MPRDVETVLNYYDDPGDGSEPTPVYVGQGTVTNERKMAEVPVTVHDISGREDEFTLDNVGFQLVERPTTATTCVVDNFENVDLIKSAYFDDCVALLREFTSASRAFIFDHKVRRGPADWHTRGAGNASQRGPLHRVHVDQSYDGAAFLVKWYLPDEADALLQRRWQIINVRPFFLILASLVSPLCLLSSLRSFLTLANARGSDSNSLAGLAPPPHHNQRSPRCRRRSLHRRLRPRRSPRRLP